ncbi:MAG: hypothetical protein ACK5KQ_00960, partial [Anaerorhabdus sp.]
MTGVSVSDTEEGNLSLTTDPTSVDTSVAGVTKVTYTASDVDGNEVTATQVVVVNDGTIVVGDAFIIQASDFTKRVSEVDTTTVKTDANVKVYTTEGTDVTATEEVTV